jgi:hypothetical protein
MSYIPFIVIGREFVGRGTSFYVSLNPGKILAFKESNKEWFVFCVHCYLLEGKDTPRISGMSITLSVNAK